jgi:phosphonate transport system substrate-binding protein
MRSLTAATRGIRPFATRIAAIGLFAAGLAHCSATANRGEPNASVSTPAVVGQPTASAATIDTTSVAAAPPAQATAEREHTIVLSTIADNPQEEEDKDNEAKDFIPFMLDHLRSFGITNVKIVYARNPGVLAQYMRQGKIDMYDESPFSSYVEHRLSGADEVILNRWKNGNEKFGGVIYSNRSGSVRSLDDLKGKLMVFRGDTSTTQYFLEKAFLANKGYKLTEKASLTEPIAPNEIGYYFAWFSRDKEVEDLMDGVAGASGNSDEFIDQLLGHDGVAGGKARHPRAGKPQTNKDDLRIIARTPQVLRRIVTIRSSMAPALKQAIKDLLLSMDKTPEGQAVLRTYGPSARFAAVDDHDAYAGIADQGNVVEEEVRKFATLKGGYPSPVKRPVD